MPLQHEESFYPTRLEEEKEKDTRRTFTVSMNPEELAQLEEDARILQQEKLSTAVKQLAAIGSIVLHSDQTKAILGLCFNNERRNRRLGVALADPKFTQK